MKRVDAESPSMLRTEGHTYGDETIQEGKRLLDAERECEGLIRRNTTESIIHAFNFGRLLFENVLQGGRGQRNGKTLLNYLKDVGYLERDAKSVPTTAYRYIHIYRGAGSVENIQRLKLSRNSYVVLGQTVRGDDFISAGLVPYLRECSVITDGQPDEEKMREIAEMVRASRRAVRFNPTLAELESARGRPIPWDRIGGMTVLGLQDSLLHGVKVDDSDSLSDTIWEMIRLDRALASATASDFRGCFTRWPTWLKGHGPSSDVASPKALIRRLDRQRRIHRIVQATPELETDLSGKILLGRSEDLLRRPEVFQPGTLGLVVTDPPYSREYYKAYRPENEVSHDMEETPSAQSLVVADVASTILSRGLHNPEGFAWVQFCPLSLVHVFVPPLLDAFYRVVGKDNTDYQLAVWDKMMTPKVSGITRFTPRLEGIICVSVGRPLRDTDENGGVIQMHLPLFACRPTKGRDDLFWKPKSLLREIIGMYMCAKPGSTDAAKQVVLDPFAGSGSTAVAAIELGMDFRLIESHPAQHELAVAEVRNARGLSNELRGEKYNQADDGLDPDDRPVIKESESTEGA